jgi:chemotaxis protein MotB
MQEHDDDGGGGHDSSERWLVSYADFITLLFALFVLLYALSMQSASQRNRSLDSMSTAVSNRPLQGGMRPELDESSRGVPNFAEMLRRHQLREVRLQLEMAVKKFSNSGISFKIDERGLVVSLSAAKFFASGDTEIALSQLPVLNAVVKRLESLPNKIEIDGFTDPIPIATERFRDNWELSAARSASVLRYTLSHSNVDPDQISIAGYGPYHPVADNRTDQGRALNRRVEIIVKPVESQ